MEAQNDLKIANSTEIFSKMHIYYQNLSSYIRKSAKSVSMMTGIQWNEYFMDLYKFLIGRPSWMPCWISQLAIIYANLCRKLHIQKTMRNIWYIIIFVKPGVGVPILFGLDYHPTILFGNCVLSLYMFYLTLWSDHLTWERWSHCCRLLCVSTFAVALRLGAGER